MKLVIVIKDEFWIKKFLSCLSLGLLDGLDQKKISTWDSMRMLYKPALMEEIKRWDPELGKALHCGTEIEDIESIMPERLERYLQNIREQHYESLQNMVEVSDGEIHVIYRLEE